LLNIVATPIGNFSDITLRAIETLENSDIILCEDSRVSAKLLNRLKIKKSLMVYNDFSGIKDREKILNLIVNEKKTLCLISDAGTPLISDPGHKLVSFLLENNIKISTIPGPCSVIAALSLSGIASDRFMFAGFLPQSKQKRLNFIEEFKYIKSTLIFFESPKRLANSLQDLHQVLGNRNATIVREITKIYEEIKKENLQELASYYAKKSVKGEIVIVISAEDKKDITVNEVEIENEINKLLKNTKPKDIAKLISQNYSINSKDIYQKILKIKDEKN
jgi:16S rRNA (cytidine1402-2'-O)-methyltransferase